MIHFLSKARKNELRGTALLRLDFNTKGHDVWRMDAVIPTIKFLLKRSDKIVIVSHRGRPSGVDRALSLKKDSRNLEKHLQRNVRFIPHFRFAEIKKTIDRAPRGSIFLLENIRFLKGEQDNNPKLGKLLASLADFYVNDSFAVDHRANASLVAITKFLPSYGGLELEQELRFLPRVIGHPQKPLVVILGGAKVKDKLGVMTFFKNKADAFLIGGAAANTLLLLGGIDVGASLVEKDGAELKKVARVLKYRTLVLPTDYVVEKRAMLDIGRKSAEIFVKKIWTARTVIWSGTMGMVEEKRFASGSLAVARAVAANKRVFSVVGGGETVMFLKKYGLDKKFSFVSTGGGAMLEFLAGKKLPGIEALKKNKK